MKIGPLESKPSTAQVASERKPAAATPGPAGSNASAHIELSSTVSALASGGVDASFDSAKVERIAQAIRDGKFEVDAEAIADKLIANAEELLSGRSR